VHGKRHERHFGLAYHHRKRENKKFLGKSPKKAILGILRNMKQKQGISGNLGAVDSL
jgi:hypothetical protein